MQSTFTLLLALLPLVAYMLTLGVIRISGVALVTTGGRDTAALAVAVAGMLAVGPGELFFPAASAVLLGPMVWLPLAVLYSLCVSLYILTRPQRLVIYGRSPDQLLDALLQSTRRLDATAVADPEALMVRLPELNVHLKIDGIRGQDPAQVTAFETNLSPKFWSLLLSSMREEVRRVPASTPRPGIAMLLVAVLIGSYLLWKGLDDRALVVEGFREWLWR